MQKLLPIAIVGMACRLPDADGLDEFWQLLEQGCNGVGELPPERLDRELYFDPQKGVRGKTYSTIGGIVAERPLDRELCPISDDDLKEADPCHVNFCEVAAAAVRQAGMDPACLPHPNTGVYVGHSGGSPLAADLAGGTLADEIFDHLRDVEGLPARTRDEIMAAAAASFRVTRPQRRASGPKTGANECANLVARTFALNGPSMAIDAACASSLVAVALAANALRHEQIDMAIVGGASYSKCDSLILFSQAQSCSATGSRPFDDRADGLISSEGYVAVVLKTLARAIEEGDTIQAVIPGIGISSDGRGRSLWAPRREGQIKALERAYGSAIPANGVQYIEAHATGTQVGDATELETLREFFGQQVSGCKLPIGSVKSNIGHTLETAGLAGLLKAVLAMQKGVIPPTINIEELNGMVPWPDLPFYVPVSSCPWPEVAPGEPRRAGVNSFGIGGLNVHVVLEEFVPKSSRTPLRAQTSGDRVAIIGRGVVFPEAFDLQAFSDFLASGRNAISEAPPQCWRQGVGIRSGRPGPWASPTRRGGFVHGYTYDWRRFKVPPKQIARANPLQFMLLDAASQAFEEAGYDEQPFDRETTAVVVGSMFGGDFGNQLQLGLRLPEVRQILGRELQRRGLSSADAATIVDSFEEHFLEAKPALLDETGSFTSSTLASRVSRTLNLQGGALAIDSGESSSLAALDVACDLLNSGMCSLIFCAGAQRSMDLPAYEFLAMNGGLLDASGGEGLLPGEGVAAVLLKRMADALRDGDTILGIIRGVGAAHEADPQRAQTEAVRRALGRAGCEVSDVTHFERGGGLKRLAEAEDKALDSLYGRSAEDALSLIPRFGHSQAAHGLASILRATLAKNNRLVTAVGGQSASGLAYHLLLGSPESKPEKTIEPQPRGECRDRVRIAQTANRILRFGAPAPGELTRQLTDARSDAGRFWEAAQPVFPEGSRFRLAIVANDVESVASKLELAAGQWQNPDARLPLEAQGIFSGEERTSRQRIAFLFPGQGSQYPGMLKALAAHSTAAREVLDEADEALSRQGLESFAELAWSDPGQLGVCSTATQLAVLVADLLVYSALLETGIRPDYISGHSYGEFPAMVAAGVWSIEQAVRATRARGDAIMSNTCEGSLLSVQAELDVLETLIQLHGGELSVTHLNAPCQTVVGGRTETITTFRDLIEKEGYRSQLLRVPRAMHTPLLLPAEEPFRQALSDEPLRPPTTALLSNVTNLYVGEPAACRENLVRQLTEPVRYSALIQRLRDDGAGVFIEVGPGQVLTGLNRQIVIDRDVLMVATDHPKRKQPEQLACVMAQVDCLGLLTPTASVAQDVRPPTAPADTRPAIEIFDATVRRRERMRAGAATMRAVDRLAAAPPGPSIAPAEVSAQQLVAAGTSSHTYAQFLIDFIVEQTGYPADILELDWDLEADLGLDSIKRAQLFGEFAELVGFSPAEQGVPLDRYRTLRQVLDLLEQCETGESPACTAAPAAARAPSPSVVNANTRPVETSVAAHDVERFLIDFVVEQTGYPPDVVDLDAEFEADLGIDSIKQAQLFGELRELFSLSLDGPNQVELSDFRTLRDVLNLIEGRQPGAVACTNRSTPGMAVPAGWTGESVGRPVTERLATQPGPGSMDTFSQTSTRPESASAAVTSRYVLRVRESPQRPGSPEVPNFNGPALILGSNTLAEALRSRLAELNVDSFVIAPSDDPLQSVAELDRIWQGGPVPHLFIVTPRDQDAATSFDRLAWHRRRARGVMTPFWVCQRWLKLVQDSRLMDDASLVGATSLGGDLGFSRRVVSGESGALTGLLKAIIIESWVGGYRTTPIKVIDTPADESPDAIVTYMLRELAVPSYDAEICWVGGKRHVVRRDCESVRGRGVTPHGTWVCTGGARGITAYVAGELAWQYGLRLHLVGTAPHPDLPGSLRDLADDELRRHRLHIMQAAREKGRNTYKAWQNTEKAVEIDHTLRKLKSMGIDVTYHSCDIADRDALQSALDDVRRADGPIHGILHGAGVGNDSRFDHKRPDKVEQSIRAKVDGALSLMELTREDPLAHFVAFGSISGRFGANGHTDYSLANDMMAKLVDWYRRQRPDVAATTFHWHAWGDVGMATKADTRLGLEMIDMQLMPAKEGLAHLVNELEAGAPEGEVLITDDKYHRVFYPDESTVSESPSPIADGGAALQLPFLAAEDFRREGDKHTTDILLDPKIEPFLTEHRLDDTPLLPVVIGLELLCEAAASLAPGTHVVGVRSLQAVNGLRFHTDQPQTTRVVAKLNGQSSVHCDLRADFCSRDGRLVEADRLYLCGAVELASEMKSWHPPARAVPSGTWDQVQYAERGSKFFLGPSLRCLRKIQMAEGFIWGRIAAPALVDLGGPHRSVAGWIVPSAALDACLYATGLLAWSQIQAGAHLPAGIGRIRLGRLPHPGEACSVESRFVKRDGPGAMFDFCLFGSDGAPLLEVNDYRVVWLGA